jgi:hypothetical protein
MLINNDLSYEAYGLTENPFTPRQVLDPLENSDDIERIVKVESFSHIDQINAALADRAVQGRPAFYLVSGRSASGRTTMAKLILALYRAHRQIEPPWFIVPSLEGPPDHYEVRTFKIWLASLASDIDIKGISLSKPLKDSIRDTIRNVDPDTMAIDFSRLVLQTSNELKKVTPAAGFGCFLENVPGYNIAQAAFQVFANAPTVCVFTVGDYENDGKEVVESVVASGRADVQVVQIDPLPGVAVEKLVKDRWHQVSNRPHPFQGANVADAFQKPRPIGTALRHVGDVLRAKLASYQRAGSWSDETLRITADELSTWLRLVEAGK